MPAEQTTRDLKIVQYLVEAHGKEKELETALQAHIGVAEKATYKKRLKDHLKETKAQSKALERRIKQLGGAPDGLLPDPVVDTAAAANTIANKAVSLAKGVGHAVRGTGVAEKQLKNAKTELFNEHEEIANYIAIEALATALNDKDTAKLAKEHRKQEERMAAFLEKLIPQLTKDVVREEIPARERRAASNGSTRRSTTSRSTSSRSTSSRSTSRAASSSSSSRRKPATTAKRAASSASSTAKSAAGTAKRSASSAKTTAKRSTAAKRSSGGTTKRSTTTKRASTARKSSS